MYHIMLIDDEPLVHHDLSTLLDWSKYGFRLCAEAYSGMMALDMMEQSLPHIAIIDVNMPGMNGVELNRTIKQRFPSVKTIMLSSYDDYDYVRECLKDGAVDYLLKHRMDGPSLLTILNKIVFEIETRGLSDHHSIEKKNEQVHPAQLREWVADSLIGNRKAVEQLMAYAAEGTLYTGAVRYAAAVVQIQPFLLLTESYSDVQINRLVQQAVEIMQQSLGDIQKRTVAYIGDGRFAVIFSFQQHSEHQIMSEINSLMGMLEHVVEMYLNFKCVYSIGYICTGLSQVKGSVKDAQRKLGLLGEERKDAGDMRTRTSLTIEEQKQLLLSLENLDKESIHHLIAAIFTSMAHFPVYSSVVQTVVSELLHIGDKAKLRWLPANMNDETGNELPSRANLAQINTLQELEHWLQSYFAKLLVLLKRNRLDGRYSRHVKQAIHYILDHYKQAITLEQTAKEIGLNSSYLSRLFKEETKITFSEYVNRVRIDAGKRLLEGGRYSIKEVSSLVGFATYNYFFKVFKELTGMTPQEYLQSVDRVHHS